MMKTAQLWYVELICSEYEHIYFFKTANKWLKNKMDYL